MLVLRRGKNRRTWKKPFWDAGIWTWASMVVSRQREMLWPLCSRPYSPSVPGTSNCISSLSSLSVNSRGVFRKMASKTSDFKPFKVSQMFSRRADLYPTSSATLLWFNSIYISGLRQRESSSGRVTKQRTFISSFPVQVRTNTRMLYSAADPGEGPERPGLPFIFRPNWGPRDRKTDFWDHPFPHLS